MAVRGRVDGMQAGDVTGWAVGAGRRPCAVIVTDDAGNRVAKGRAFHERGDLAALRLGRSNLAFRLELPGCMQRRAFHVHADGFELPGSPLELGPGRYDGDCMIDGGVLKGWVRERIPQLSEPSIQVVTQHGQVVGIGQSGRDPQAGAPRAAFAITLHNGCFGAGMLRLRVLADGMKFTEITCDFALHGNIDAITQESCAGWLIAPDAPQRDLEIDVFRNEIPVATARCSLRRGDVDALYPGSLSAGFAASFPWQDSKETEPASISLRLRGAGVELFGGPFCVAGRPAAIIAAQRAARMAHDGSLGPAEKAVIQLALRNFLATARAGKGFAVPLPAPLPRRPEPRVSIVIPVYAGLQATRNCIVSVLTHRQAATDRVVLINDASPEPGMADMLEEFLSESNLFLLNNASNLGFIRTVNRGFAFAGTDDVLLLNADTIVFAGAFDELHAIAYSAADIGTVTALSNDATIFSYPGDALRRARLQDCGWAELAGIARARNTGLAIDVPTAHGFCVWIKGEARRQTGVFDEDFGRGYGEENDFSIRAADLGYRHVAAAGVFVQHIGGLSFQVERDVLLAENLARLAARYPEYFPLLRDFERRDGLRSARWALDAWRLQRARQGGARFVLVISNSLGGGSAKAVADIEQAVGYGAAIKLSLNCREDGVITLSAATPEFRAGFAGGEIAPLFGLLDAAQPDGVLVHQLLGFSAAFIRRLSEWGQGRRRIFFVHDFYALCPRVTFIDAVGDFCDLAKTSSCERCLSIGGAHDAARLTGADPAAHRALFAQMLRGFTKVIAPSESAAGFFRRGFPGLRVSVIAHPESGIAPAGQAVKTHGPEHRSVRHAEDDEEIVLFGALGPHKGSHRLLEIARRAKLTQPSLVFRVIGYTSLDEELLACGNVILTGRYMAASLPHLVAEARGRLALFLHEWPETYSYTLSEALSYGFIPIVPDIGAPADRVRAMRFGAVYPFPADATAILALLQAMRLGRVPGFAEDSRPEDFHPRAAAIGQLRAALGFAAALRKPRSRNRAQIRRPAETGEKHPPQ